MPTRTLPTRDVTLADGRRLYYQQGESRQYAASGKHASVYMTKRGPDGALRILVTVDEEPERGEHYHLSASYPDFTPTPDEMLAVVAALLPGGQYGAMTPESHPQQALHGHVVHLIEEPPAYAARRADIPPVPKTSTSTLVRVQGSTPCTAPSPSMPTAPRSSAPSVRNWGSPRPLPWTRSARHSTICAAGAAWPPAPCRSPAARLRTRQASATSSPSPHMPPSLSESMLPSMAWPTSSPSTRRSPPASTRPTKSARPRTRPTPYLRS